VPIALTSGLLSLWALVIAGTDFRQLRVPNSLLLLVLVPAALMQLIQGAGLLGVGNADALSGFGIGLLLGLPGYALRQFGAGDVKYMAVLGLLCGPRGILAITLVAAILLGLMSVSVAVIARLQRRQPGRMPAAIALSSGFLLLLILSGNFAHGF
jgi:prepilin peptidase CpaA